MSSSNNNSSSNNGSMDAPSRRSCSRPSASASKWSSGCCGSRSRAWATTPARARCCADWCWPCSCTGGRHPRGGRDRPDAVRRGHGHAAGQGGGQAQALGDWKRNAAIGAAAVTGGALLAVTGGLAAPAIAASLTALGGAGVTIGAAVGSTVGSLLRRCCLELQVPV